MTFDLSKFTGKNKLTSSILVGLSLVIGAFILKFSNNNIYSTCCGCLVIGVSIILIVHSYIRSAVHEDYEDIINKKDNLIKQNKDTIKQLNTILKGTTDLNIELNKSFRSEISPSTITEDVKVRGDTFKREL